jgi:DMSO/TMAO reductase YedYZ molybdopterin-dependent catalytic subunit
MTRRGALCLLGAKGLMGQPREYSGAKVIAYPLRDVENTITPTDEFFVRNHFGEPEVSASSWKLRVEGRVARPFEMSLSDLLQSRTSKIESVMECAGNDAGGAAVSNGVWEGLPFSELFGEARPDRDAVHVLLEAADHGSFCRECADLPFTRVVPLSRCQRSDSLVAFKHNDALLRRAHGFPARVILPGWYGVNWVKWLRRIVLMGANDGPTALEKSGFDRLYNRVIGIPGTHAAVVPVSEMLVKSAIASPNPWPEEFAKLPAGNLQVWGFAWSGAGAIRSVEISSNGGENWNRARFDSPSRPLTWVRWQYTWAASPGEHALMSRATDEKGNQQPLFRDPLRLDAYELNWCVPVRCVVR